MITELKRKPIEGAECAAAKLRDLADMLEDGECRSVVAVAYLTAEKCFYKTADFEDAWKLLAALEYAKDAVLKGMGSCDD